MFCNVARCSTLTRLFYGTADAKRFTNRSKTPFYPGCQNLLPQIGLAEETRLQPALDDFFRYIFRIGFIY